MAVFLGHGREGAEDEAIDVGDDGGTPGEDAAFGEEIVEIAERFVEGFGGLKVFALAHERGAGSSYSPVPSIKNAIC